MPRLRKNKAQVKLGIQSSLSHPRRFAARRGGQADADPNYSARVTGGRGRVTGDSSQ